MKKGKIKKNYFKNLMKNLLQIAGYAILVMAAMYLITDYAMTTDGAPFLDYIRLTPELATYIHHQIALPFAGCVVFYVLATLDK
ncbi:MAG: hypothetical protein PHE78_03155 [Candidatus Gastranaerophilales bacterium]|jgi:hypothetical protein|nr:hypothetical protein [Candidatus Gastranaerophilales bacterium]